VALKMLPFTLFAGGKFGKGAGGRAESRPEVGAIRHLCTHDVRPVNLTAPAPVTNSEFTVLAGVAHFTLLVPRARPCCW
jgi:NAD dependent epimerase/dehydratase family enzyme